MKDMDTFESRSETTPFEQAATAFREILPNAEDSLSSVSYLTADYTDSKGRYAEVRMMASSDDLSLFNLNANIGNGLALLELAEKLRKRGVKIGRLACYLADPETEAILAANSFK